MRQTTVSIIKKGIRTLLIVLGIILGILFILLLLIKYELSWRITDVETVEAPDGKHSISFQAVGEPDFPFGSSHAKVTVYEGEKVIQTFREDIADDGAVFRPANYSVDWVKYGVVITFKGSEQADHEIEIFYDGRESFAGYTKEEIEDILVDRYMFSNVDNISEEPTGYQIKADGIVFHTDSKMALHDSFYQEKIKALTEEVFTELIHRNLSWDIEGGDSPVDITYTPIITMNGPGKQDIDSYCSDICEWLTYCFDELPYEEAENAYTGFIPEIYGYQNVKFRFEGYGLDRFTDNPTDFYNVLFVYLNRFMDHEYDILFNISDSSGTAPEINNRGVEKEDAQIPLITDETISTWASYDADAVFDFSDGREYALIPVDRALGSSYYVLLSFEKNGEKDSAQLVNSDPFNGQGGEAGFISFLEDEKVGFATLTYNGGSEGILYRTDDAGESFEEVILPSPEILLPDGKMYNPFVVPEEVWEESGIVFLEVGQGPDGDYYDEELDDHPAGIYRSDNNGRTFVFEEVVKDQ